MENINDQDLLDEIRFDIKEKDMIKARLVLASLDFVERETQKRALFEVSRADDDFSIPLLTGVIANSIDLMETFPQLKETLVSKILDNPQVLLKLLPDALQHKEKILLIETAGELQMKKAVPVMLDILETESDSSVIKSIIESLGMIGDPSSVDAIAGFLHSSDRDIVITAVQALGETGSAAAAEALSARIGKEKDIDLMILNSISKLQIPEAYEKLNEILGSDFVHLRAEAKKKLVEIGSISLHFMVKNLSHKNPDFVVHSLNVIGDLGDGSAISHIRKLLFNEPENPNIRFAAYEALGRLPLDKGAFALASGLEDPVDNVRSAAARAIDRNYNPVLGGGIKNMIKGGDAQAIRIIKAIIDTQCRNIFFDLINDDLFRESAVNYLVNKAHPEIKAFYSDLLLKTDYSELAHSVAPEKLSDEETGTLKVYAVDDSRMILNIYRTILHNLKCDSMLFEFPAMALEQIKKEKPDIILTDLNMPDISGIDLTVSIRKSYSREELPVIMVTTQEEGKDREAAFNAGVNGILQKPFSEGLIGKALAKFARYR